MTYPSTLRYLGRLWKAVDRTKDTEGRVWVKATNGGEVLWILESCLSRERREGRV